MQAKREKTLADPEAYRQDQLKHRLPDDFDDLPEEEQEEILKRGTDDDVSVRAKSSGHGKKTADKWNQ